MLTKNAISNMQNRYIAVLKKCRLLNAFGSLAVVSMLAMGACGMVGAEGVVNDAWAENITDSDITDRDIYDNKYSINNATQTGSINVSQDFSFSVSGGNSSYTVNSNSTITGSLTLKGNDSNTLEFTVASTLSVSGATTIESGGTLDNNSGSISGARYVSGSTTIESGGLPLLDKSLSDHIDSATTLPDFIHDAFHTISDEKKAAATIEGAAKMSICAGILTSLASLDGLGASAVQARSSFKGAANMSTSTISQKDAFLASNNGSFSDTPVPVISDAGTAGGMLNGFALWLQPTYKSLSADGLTSGNFEYGYDTTILGVSLGADYTVGNSLRFGLAFHSGNGETESSSDSDFNYTEDDFEYAGLTFYSAYVHNNLSLALDMGYIATTNSVTQQTTIGNLYTGDFTAGVLCLGLRSEYKIATSFLDLIPYMGARFNYFEIESFDTKDNNGIVYENKASYASTFGMPIGINVTKAFVDDGVTYTPRASLGMQFTMGDLDVEQRVSIPSVGGHARMENEIFDPVTFMGGIGLGVAKDNVTFALDYSIGASEHTTSHQVMATFGYRF